MTIPTLLTLATGFVSGLCALMIFAVCRRKDEGLDQKLQRAVTNSGEFSKADWIASRPSHGED